MQEATSPVVGLTGFQLDNDDDTLHIQFLAEPQEAS